MNNIDILEELSNNEHIRWANWQKYVHSKCIKNEDGSLTIPKEYVEHWEYEINTDYDDLPDNIKESDRREVRQILEKLNYSTLIAENKELKEENKELKEFKENIEKIDRKQLDKLYEDAQKALKEYRETQNKVAKLEEENKELKEENLELLTRLRADGLIDRDKYWINKIKEAIYKGTLEAKGWDCEGGAYCVKKEFQKLLGKE